MTKEPTTTPDFTDDKPFRQEARRLVEECVVAANHVPCDCEDLWCIHWKDKVSERIASFAAEAATQGQADRGKRNDH